jgi:8-oxo-dGTP pyrophosphatase MutT (NUDIX family)
MLTEKVKFLQKAALIYGDKILVLKRSMDAGSRPGAWDLPGGNAEWPVGLTENKLDLHQLDIAREIQEEIGLAIPPANFTHDKLVLFKTFFEPARNRYDFICGWAVLAENELDPSSVVISDEHSEYRWVTEAEALELDFDEPTGTFVKEIIISAFRLKK